MELTQSPTEEIKSFFYPTTWSVDQIQPQLHIFRKGRDQLIIHHELTAKAAVLLLNQNNYFSTISRLTYIVHGFRNTIETEWLTEMKDAMLAQNEECLVVIVSWGKGSDLLPIYYLQAAANIQAVGDWLAPFASEVAVLKPEIEQYAVGHSLGSHLIGIAGRKSGVFKRISALDPAGPAFEHGEFLEYRLKSTDAQEMVDVIHTDGFHSKLDPIDWFGPVNHYGTLIPLGTIDFYPNFGYCQPGSGTFEVAGSHTRAIEYFIWSISNPKKFQTNTILDGTPSFETPIKKVKEVEANAEMGYFANVGDKTGLFYIATNKTSPWITECEENMTQQTYCIIS